MEPTWELEEPVEPQSEQPNQAVQEETSALAVSVDDFAALEERVRRAVDVVKREREARAEAETRATKFEARATQAEARQADLEARATLAEAQLKSQTPLMEQLKRDVGVLNTERDQVKQRVERLLAQLDAIEL